MAWVAYVFVAGVLIDQLFAFNEPCEQNAKISNAPAQAACASGRGAGTPFVLFAGKPTDQPACCSCTNPVNQVVASDRARSQADNAAAEKAQRREKRVAARVRALILRPAHKSLCPEGCAPK